MTEKKTGKHQLVIWLGGRQGTQTCGVCELPVQTGACEPEIILRETTEPVCNDCVTRYADPELVEMLRFWQARDLWHALSERQHPDEK